MPSIVTEEALARFAPAATAPWPTPCALMADLQANAWTSHGEDVEVSAIPEEHRSSVRKSFDGSGDRQDGRNRLAEGSPLRLRIACGGNSRIASWFRLTQALKLRKECGFGDTYVIEAA